ncbi:transcriptional regulator, TetR family [Sphingomonas palmae]|uniref:Transcriptional regulator, TetR family n=1 Tax=Sphingomonas palmae TaxID=1855283 RepID=A0A1H7SY36_9SPHN|nr:TetR/AcrR family transcriptional regulator [Sphingomonas palmae]SEL77562.1 transcriptional regulator, TetR family [Sphingomonas palmae]
MHTRILDAAEMLLRRYGLPKLNVVDVSRHLNMSHGNVYRHFSSKTALRSAVVERWLGRVSEQTGAIAHKQGPADQRLIEWLRTLAAIKQRKVTDDAELLRAAVQVVRDTPAVQDHHADLLTRQLTGILADGKNDATLPRVDEPRRTAVAILDATTRFHHPDMVANGGAPEDQMHGLEAVIALILSAIGEAGAIARR